MSSARFDKPSALTIVNIDEIAKIVSEKGVPVHGADALGLTLLSNGELGADVLWVPAGARFPVHTHPGHHLLLCMSGAGTITVDAQTHQVRPGDFYLINGAEPHAVGAAADQDHILLSIGVPHKPVQSPDRMQITDWAGSPLGVPIFVSNGVAADYLAPPGDDC